MNPLDEPMQDVDYISVSPWSTIFKFGLIGSVGIILLSTFNFLFGQESSSSSGAAILSFVALALTVFIYILVMIFSIKEYRDKYSDGYVSLGKGMLTSYGAAMLTGVAALSYSLLYLLVIDPEYMNRAMEKAYEDMRISGTDPIANTFSTELIIGTQMGSFILGAIIGLVLSLIISAIMKKDRPSYATHS